ncbi:MAG: SsrA-binding protein SmpB [Spirochaetales bacterium]|nr:SsrA-binding protein SmpB [Spirochaetales bacterium]
MAKSKEPQKSLSINRKAHFNYSVLESMECGIQLQGTEVKSMKINKFSYADAYGKIENDELWLMGLHITHYDFGNIHNHDPDRKRRLLVHKQEIKRLKRKIQEKGLTLVPLKFYLKGGLIKLELGLCKGKKTFDKRDEIKQRDMQRDSERDFKFN